jgi:hypothetical protein
VFNPVTKMELVELIFPSAASAETRERALALCEALEKTPVDSSAGAKDSSAGARTHPRARRTHPRREGLVRGGEGLVLGAKTYLR